MQERWGLGGAPSASTLSFRTPFALGEPVGGERGSGRKRRAHTQQPRRAPADRNSSRQTSHLHVLGLRWLRRGLRGGTLEEEVGELSGSLGKLAGQGPGSESASVNLDGDGRRASSPTWLWGAAGFPRMRSPVRVRVQLQTMPRCPAEPLPAAARGPFGKHVPGLCRSQEGILFYCKHPPPPNSRV